MFVGAYFEYGRMQNTRIETLCMHETLPCDATGARFYNNLSSLVRITS